jgi:hypothetical protein
MEREYASLAREFKVAEQAYGSDHLVWANGRLSKPMRNGLVVGYLAKNYQTLQFELQKNSQKTERPRPYQPHRPLSCRRLDDSQWRPD